MAGRIDYAISVTAIQQDSAFQGEVQEVVEEDIRRSLGGGNTNLSWNGDSPAGWTDGVYTHKEATSSGETIAADGDDGVFIKHTGFEWDNSASNKVGTTANSETVTIKVGSTSICELLDKGDCIFIPKPKGDIKIFGPDTDGPAVEIAKLT